MDKTIFLLTGFRNRRKILSDLGEKPLAQSVLLVRPERKKMYSILKQGKRQTSQNEIQSILGITVNFSKRYFQIKKSTVYFIYVAFAYIILLRVRSN